jgi:hypothetical protein
MNLIGPKSVAARLHLVVKILLFLAVARALLLAVLPILPFTWHYLSFEVQTGPLHASFDALRGGEARWWIWAMEMVSRTSHAVVLYLLMRILSPAGAGEPFHPQTPHFLRIIGCAVVISSLLRTCFCAALLGWGRALGSGASLTWAIDFDAILMGLVLVILAEVFRRGYVLKAESELTV